MRNVLLYLFAATIPLFLGLTAWQSVRYSTLETQTRTLETDQRELVESNDRLIAEIAALTSSGNVGSVASKNLKLAKVLPENVLQIWIDRK